jgi:hypothetical protein
MFVAAAPFEANVFLAVALLAATVGLVVGFFTVRGSGIANHPWDGDGSPGAHLPDEFHQFADRQIHDHDMRELEIERRVDARLAAKGYFDDIEVVHDIDVTPRTPATAGDISLDEANRRLAAEAAARKAAKETSATRAEKV